MNAQLLEKELHGNKKLIAMTMGDDGNSSGSDSEPSADNLDAEEIEKIIPQKKKEEPKYETKAQALEAMSDIVAKMQKCPLF